MFDSRQQVGKWSALWCARTLWGDSCVLYLNKGLEYTDVCTCTETQERLIYNSCIMLCVNFTAKLKWE